MVVKHGKHQRSKKDAKKVHDHTQSFVLSSCSIHELHAKTFLLVSSSVSSKQLLCFVHGQGQESTQKHATKNLVEFQNHFFVLAMITVSFFVAGCEYGKEALGEFR